MDESWTFTFWLWCCRVVNQFICIFTLKKIWNCSTFLKIDGEHVSVSKDIRVWKKQNKQTHSHIHQMQLWKNILLDKMRSFASEKCKFFLNWNKLCIGQVSLDQQNKHDDCFGYFIALKLIYESFIFRVDEGWFLCWFFLGGNCLNRIIKKPVMYTHCLLE